MPLQGLKSRSRGSRKLVAQWLETIALSSAVFWNSSMQVFQTHHTAASYLITVYTGVLLYVMPSYWPGELPSWLTNKGAAPNRTHAQCDTPQHRSREEILEEIVGPYAPQWVSNSPYFCDVSSLLGSLYELRFPLFQDASHHNITNSSNYGGTHGVINRKHSNRSVHKLERYNSRDHRSG